MTAGCLSAEQEIKQRLLFVSWLRALTAMAFLKNVQNMNPNIESGPNNYTRTSPRYICNSLR